MSTPDPAAPSDAIAVAPTWTVGLATPRDVPGAALGVARLLEELGAAPPSLERMEDAARVVVHDPSVGSLLIATTDDDTVVGLLGSSWRTAMHRCGRYAVIEELWVDPDWRSLAVGRSLVEALVDGVLPREQIDCVEVGLPRPTFPMVEATTAFYRSCGFSPVGARMRRMVP